MPSAVAPQDTRSFDDDVAAHDARLAALGLVVWVGSEPTFTDRHALSPTWLSAALGEEKEARARLLMSGLCRRFPGGVLLRSEGRRYPGEDRPRWNLGLFRRRDGTPVWDGPPDPIESAASIATTELPALQTWAESLADSLQRADFERVQLVEDSKPKQGLGVGFRPADTERAVFVLTLTELDGQATPCVEMPLFTAVADFLAALACLAESARACRLPALVLAGNPPPTDASVELTTVTPDPAVIEINSAPSSTATAFLHYSRHIYAAAAERGLAPYRLHYNGAVADSGGGGQLTLGGPSPLASPFLRAPQLLPRLVRFFNRHPSLSYRYSHDFVGSSGQSARADERGPDACDELALALHLLAQQPQPEPELLWRSLAPLLCDAVGNSHRAELNIEKLWNTSLGPRGVQGLVEFRALRMQHTPERATALACLLRAIVAVLTAGTDDPPLVDWGRELHERFALPYYLGQDLRAVLSALDAADLGLGPAIRAELLREGFGQFGQVRLPGCTLEIRRALEFWPLIGDATSPDQGGSSRLVDASTARVELRLRQDAPPGGWQVLVASRVLPMRAERDAEGELGVYGLRYRCFVPKLGLHPTLGSQAPLRLRLRHPAHEADQLVTLHEWRPDGGAYDGLPEDLEAASRRRAARVTVEPMPRDGAAPGPGAHELDAGAYTMDLRRLGAAMPG